MIKIFNITDLLIKKISETNNNIKKYPKNLKWQIFFAK